MHKSTEEFFRMFTGGKADLGKALEGYICCKWPSLYIYHLRNLASDPQVRSPYPHGVVSQEADEMARLAVERMLPTLSSEQRPAHIMVRCLR